MCALKAEPYLRKKLEGDRRTLGSEHADTLATLGNLGVVLMQQGKLDEAEPFLLEALEALREVAGDDPPSLMAFTSALSAVGDLFMRQGKPAQAEPHFRELLKIVREKGGDDDPNISILATSLGLALMDQGELDEAVAYLREALEDL